MDRSLWAVLGGTFTLRFSTGLTGAMLGVYLAKLPEHGGPGRDRDDARRCSMRTFYLAELVLSPFFGVLSDRLGHHRVMLFGPVFGAAAVILTGLTTNLAPARRHAAPRGRLDRREHPVDPRLHRGGHGGQRAPARQGGGALRGRDPGRASGRASRSRRSCSRPSARTRSSSTPRSTACRSSSTATASRTTTRTSGPLVRPPRRSPRVDWRATATLLRSSHVWLLAPTWIAVNAAIGLWFSQSHLPVLEGGPATSRTRP